LEQEEKKADKYKFLFSWKHFPIIVGGFNSGGGRAEKPNFKGAPLENMIFAIL